jgi:hypothetical protein
MVKMRKALTIPQRESLSLDIRVDTCNLGRRLLMHCHSWLYSIMQLEMLDSYTLFWNIQILQYNTDCWHRNSAKDVWCSIVLLIRDTKVDYIREILYWLHFSHLSIRLVCPITRLYGLLDHCAIIKNTLRRIWWDWSGKYTDCWREWKTYDLTKIN